MHATSIAILALFATGAPLAAQGSEPVPDLRKVLVEGPLKRALESGAAGERHGRLEAERVRPGLVAWHGSFEEACAASAASGKPVLLFQLLGRLDEEFC